VVEPAADRSPFPAGVDFCGDQTVADRFCELGLIPKPIVVQDIVWTGKAGCWMRSSPVGLTREFIAERIAPHSQKHSFHDGSIIDQFCHRNYLNNKFQGRPK
jgi:hypothetical protein